MLSIADLSSYTGLRYFEHILTSKLLKYPIITTDLSQGKIGELDLYKQLRAKGEPSPLLRIAEAWLRAELVAKRAENVKEQAEGPAAIQVFLVDLFHRLFFSVRTVFLLPICIHYNRSVKLSVTCSSTISNHHDLLRNDSRFKHNSDIIN